jgi:hypothetical protein
MAMTVQLVLFAAIAAVALYALRFRPVVAFLAGRKIGARVAARLPDAVRLVPMSDPPWSDRAKVDGIRSDLLGAGFAPAGSFSVHGLAGACVELLVHEGDAMLAEIDEVRGGSGPSCALLTVYTDGTRSSFSMRPATGLAARPGLVAVHLPGATAAQLVSRARADRQQKPMQPQTVAAAPGLYERLLAEGFAWRKQQGFSQREMMQVALRRPVTSARQAPS